MSKVKKQVIVSTTFDPAINLAYEEYLMRNQEPGTCTLFLYQNTHTIVIGQNQNPWKECNVELFNKDNGTIIRRLSGGGAVYHDKGNLNFSLITDKNNYSLKDNLQVVIKALNQLDLNVNYSGKNDLLINGYKFSGNAFYEEEDNCCHHGTLLINSDLNILSKYLTPSKLKLVSKSISSVASRVTNLTKFNPSITIESVIKALIKSFKGESQEILSKSFDINLISLKPIVSKYKSWEWTYQLSPAFEMTVQRKYSWGLVELNLSVKQGYIEKLRFYTDSLEYRLFNYLNEDLIAKQFNLDGMIAVVNKYAYLNHEICNDLKEMIATII